MGCLEKVVTVGNRADWGRDGNSFDFCGLIWLPKTDTYPNTRLENPAWPQFSTLLTEAEDVESKDCWGGFACK